MSSSKGKILFYKIRVLREKYIMATKNDETYIREVFAQRFGREINLKDPKTLSEKLQWLKLFYRDDRLPICSDKFEVHNYLESIGYGYLGNKVIGVYENAKDIDYNSLPNKFVAKATHGSGWNLIVKNKNDINWNDSVKLMNSWLKLNLFAFGREWNYKDIKPRIVVEEFINHEPLNDYKFMCYNGEPLYMQLNNDFNGKHYVDFYDLKTWEHIPATYSDYKFSERTIEKPEQFDKMMELARELSKPFPFVRVDFYSFDDTILLGELTFFPAGGLRPFLPRGYGFNELMGKQLKLPEPNYNLSLYKKINS
ncbi:MAG: glycosyl transferase [Eubacterium sp.]|nr:glycosyl transferase [Eubacterium sp.]